jgi:mono/diheme cytochrome c family protein
MVDCHQDEPAAVPVARATIKGARTEKKPVQPIKCDEEWHPPTHSGLRQLGIAFLWACLIAAPVLGMGGWVIYSDWRATEDSWLAAIEATQAYERLIVAAPGAMLPIPDAVHGRELFASVCIACHGPQGTGVDGLGKNLVESDFVAGNTDDAMRKFLITGRPSARPVAMPPKGGREDLTEEDLRHIVTYVRGLQDPRRMPELPAVVVAPPSAEQKAAALTAAGGDAELAGYIANGDKLFHSTCIACHGKAGVGIQGNGKALVKNSFIQDSQRRWPARVRQAGAVPHGPEEHHRHPDAAQGWQPLPCPKTTFSTSSRICGRCRAPNPQPRTPAR